MSHSQFHCTGRAYLDMHGLIFETSICYWQDQPGRSASLAGPAGRPVGNRPGLPAVERGRDARERAGERSTRRAEHPRGRGERREPRAAASRRERREPPTHTHRRGERAAHGGTRTDERERRAGGGRRVAGTGRGHPSGTAEPPRDGRAPARRTAPTDHAAVPSRRPRAGARERVWSRGGPPTHTRQRGATPGRAGRSRTRSGRGRETGNRPGGRRHTAPTGLAGETDGGRPRTRGGGGGDRDTAKKPGRARTRKRGGEAGGRGKRRRRHADGLPLEGREGGRRGPRRSDGPGPRGRGESSTGTPAARRTGGEKARKRGVSHRQAPNPVRWRFPTRDAPLPGARRRRRRGRKSPQTHLSRRTHRYAADDGRPLSLLPSRGSRNTRSLASRTLFLARTHRRDRRARHHRRKTAGGDGPRRVRRRAGRRPTAILSKGRTRERGHDPAKPEPDPRPRGGTGQPLLPNRGNAAGEGERGDLHTAHNTSDARTRRARRGRGPRERQRRGSAGGPARGGHGRWTGGAREPTATQPRSSRSAPRPDRGACAPSGER